MSLVKVIRHGQVTLPAAIRKKLRVEEGDYLEAEIVEGAVVLRPKTVIDRASAWNEIKEIVQEKKWVGPELSEDDLLAMIDDDVHRRRAESDEGGSR
ncbi:MAG: AbrB/MazE/SpoVT family DNA-binding domain-containing protein [Geminicoccaceae bacterium]